MKTLNIKRLRGFTVIELMIVVIIIALLVALAYPSYIKYVRKAKRGEAQQLLLNWAINSEIWRSNNPCYGSDCDDPDAPGAEAPVHDDYGFVWSNGSATTYTLTANAEGDQDKDRARDGFPCRSLSLNERGFKDPPSCWE